MQRKESVNTNADYPQLSINRLNFEYHFLVHFVHNKKLRSLDVGGNKRKMSVEANFNTSVWAFEQATCVLKNIEDEEVLTQATVFISNLLPEVTHVWQEKMNKEIYLERNVKRVVSAFELASNKVD